MQSLVYSRVAAMVRACQFKIDDTLQPEEIPFCGEATANKIKDIARTGTTSVLEAHRCRLLPICSHNSSALMLQEIDHCVSVDSTLVICCWPVRPVTCANLGILNPKIYRNSHLTWHASRRESFSSWSAFYSLHIVK